MVNERSTKFLTVTFRDKTQALVAPSTISYRIDCRTTGAMVRASTSVGAATSVEIMLTSTDNAIQNQGNASEVRRVTVDATFGAGNELHDQFDYSVLNLEHVP